MVGHGDMVEGVAALVAGLSGGATGTGEDASAAGSGAPTLLPPESVTEAAATAPTAASGWNLVLG